MAAMSPASSFIWFVESVLGTETAESGFSFAMWLLALCC